MCFASICKTLFIAFILAMVLSFCPIVPQSLLAAENAGFSKESTEEIGNTPNSGVAADGIIVKYKGNADLYPASAGKENGGQNPSGLVKVEPEPGKTIGEKIKELKVDPSVEYAEPNYILSSQAVDDTLASQQWAFPVLHTEDAWSDLQAYLNNYGINARLVKVAVIDTGIDGTHEDLAGKVAAGKNILTGSDIPANALSDDSVNSHGTMVAGIIAANTNNAAGIAGMTGSFPISLMPVKVLDQNGYGTMLDIINGITWAADQGADIINMSFGGRLPDYPLALAEAVQYAGNQGAILIAAAGNEGVSLKGFYPADLEGVLCAAAYEKQATKYVIASFSNTDYLWNAYTKKCFLLPGVDIISTTRVNQYGLFSGTSASAAFLSSFAALVATCSDASEAKDRVLASIQSGAYYGDLTVGIFDAPTAYNVTDELWYYETDATPWGAFRYEGSNVVRNTVNLPVYVNQPRLVDSVSFYMGEGSGDLSSDKTLLGTVPNNDKKTMANYLLPWDTAGIRDGVYTLYVKINHIGAGPEEENPDDWDYIQLSVYNNVQSGLSVTVKQADGSPAAGALVSVWEVQRSSSGEQYACVLDEPVQTDVDGNLNLTGLTAADGLEYLVTARGTNPGFYYMTRVTSPANIIFDTSMAAEITVQGVQADTVLTAADFLIKPVLPGEILQDDKAQNCLSELGYITLGKLDNKGLGTFYASPGSYHSSVLDNRQLYFLNRDIFIPVIDAGTPPKDKRILLDYAVEIQEVVEIFLQGGTNDTPDYFGIACDVEDTENVESLIGLELFGPDQPFKITAGTYTMAATAFYSNPYTSLPHRYTLVTYNLGRQNITTGQTMVIGGETTGGDRFKLSSFYINDKEINPLLVPSLYAEEDAYYRIRCTDAQDHSVIRTGSVDIVPSPDGGVILSKTDVNEAESEMISTTGMVLKNYRFNYNPLFLYRHVNGNWTEVDVMGQSITFMDYSMKTGEAYLKSDASYLKPSGSYKAQAYVYLDNTNYLIQDGLFNVIGPNTEAKNLTILASLDGTNPWGNVSTWDLAEFMLYRLQDGVYTPYPSDTAYTSLVNDAYVPGIYTLNNIPFSPTEPLLLVLCGPNGQSTGGYPDYTLLYRHFTLSELFHDPSTNTWTINVDGTAYQLVKASISTVDEAGIPLDNLDGSLGIDMEYGLTFSDGSGNPAYFPTNQASKALWLPNTANYTVTAVRMPQDRVLKSYFFSGALDVKGKTPDGSSESLTLGGSPLHRISVSLNGKDLESAYRIIGIGLKPQAFHRPFAFYPLQAMPNGGGMEDMMQSLSYEGPTQMDSFQVWATPGLYEANILLARHHVSGVWGYRLSRAADVENADTLLQTDDDFTMHLDLKKLYIAAGAKAEFLPIVGDSHGNRLVSVFPGAEDPTAWPFGALDYDSIAPAISVKNQEGQEILRIRRGDATLSGGQRQLLAFMGGRNDGALYLKEYSQDTTYFTGVAEDLLEGAYTAAISFSPGPEGTAIGEIAGFLVRDLASSPTASLFGPEKPVNTWSAPVRGISPPGAAVTLSYIMESNPSIAGTLATVTADERGAFAAIVPLSEEGLYTITAAVSHNSQSGTHLAPAYIDADQTPPLMPSGFKAVGQDETSILLSWEASIDTGSGIAGYALCRDGIKIAALGAVALSYQDTHLSPGINYAYTLTAIDLAGNESLVAQTTGNPSLEGDTEPPSVPAGLTAENAPGSVVLRWTAATDNIGVAGYIIYRGLSADSLEEIDRTTGSLLQYSDRSVGFNQTYYYRIDAYDPTGNQSAPAPQQVVSITTEAAVISEVRVDMAMNEFGYAVSREINLGVYANSGAPAASAAVTYEKWNGLDESLGSTEVTLEVNLKEAPEGFYSAGFSLPEGTIRINRILATVGDESHQAEREGLSTPVEFASNLMVQLISPEESDISKFRVELLSSSTADRKSLTTVNGSGEYLLENLSPGADYTLRLLDDKGRVIFQQSDIQIVSGLIKRADISLAALSSLQVKVVDRAGNPMDQVKMTLLDSAGSVLTMGSSFSDGWVRKLLANGNPTSAMELLYYVSAGQQYTLVFSGFDNYMYKLRYVPFPDKTFVLAPGLNTVEIVLESQQREDVSGRVLDFDTGEPVPGIIVDACSAAGGSYSTMTDNNGAFIFGESKPLPAYAAVTLTARTADDAYQTVSYHIQPVDLDIPQEIRIRQQSYVDLTLDIQVKTWENGEYYAFNDESNRLEYVYPGNSKLSVDFGGFRFVQKGLMTYRIYGDFTSGQEIPVSVDGSGYNLNNKTVAAAIRDDGKSAIAVIKLEEKPRINVRFTDENGNGQAGLYRMLALFDTSKPDHPRFIISKQFDSADTFIHTPGPGTYSLIAAWGVASGRDQAKYDYWQSLPVNKYLLYENLSPEGLMEIRASLAPTMRLFPRLELNYMFLDGIYNFPNGATGINYQVFFKPSDPMGKAEGYLYHVTLPAGLTVQAKPSAALQISQLPDGRLDVVSDSENTFILFIEVPPGHDKNGMFAEMWAEYSMGGTTYTETIRQVDIEYLAHTIEAPDVVYGENLIFMQDMDIKNADQDSGKITVSGSATGPEVPATVYVYDGSLEVGRISIQGGINVRWETKINLRKNEVPGKTYLRAKIVYQMPDGTTKTYQTQNTAVNIVKAGQSSGEYVKFNMHGFDSGVTFSHTFVPDGYGQSFRMEGLNIFQGDILHCSFEAKLNKPHLYDNVEIAAVSGNSYDIIPLTYYPDEGIFFGYGTLGEDGSMIEQIRLMYDLKPFSAAYPFTMELPQEIPDNDDFYWRLPPEIRDAEITVGSPGDNADPALVNPGPVDFLQLAGEDGQYVLPQVTITLPAGQQFVIQQRYFPAEGSQLLDSSQKLDLGDGRFAYFGFEEIPEEKFTAIIRAPLQYLLPMEVPGDFSAAGYGLNSEVFGVTEMLFKLNDVREAKNTIWDIWENVDDYKERMSGIDQLDEDLSQGGCGGMADGMIDSTLKGLRKNASNFAYGKSLMNVAGYVAPGIYNAMAAEMGGIIMQGYEGIFAQQARDILDALREVRDSECDNDYYDDDDYDRDRDKKKKKKKDYDKEIFEPVILVDPSGYVFEAVPENRLEAVSASIYYLDGDGKWQPYDSESFDQGPNPNITDIAGKYGWDVFSGQWQVVYEKEGYQTERSMILPVPPPHVDVNISMVSLDAPAVAEVYAGSGGAYIQMEFSHYMLTDAVTNGTVTVSSGETMVSGVVAAMDAKTTSGGNKQYVPGDGSPGIVVENGVSVARVFRFIPDGGIDLTVGAEYTVTISGKATAYNKRSLCENQGATGINSHGDWQGTVTVPETALISLESIRFNADPVIRINKHQILDLSELLKIYPAEANSFTVSWSSNSPDIASVNEDGVVNGIAKGTATILARTSTGLVAGITIEVYEEPRTVPLSADYTKNTIQFCRDYLVLGQGCYMMATGDRQGEAGLVAGDERYIPVSWRMNDTAGSSGRWSTPPYSTAYTASQEGSLTTWVVFRKQVFDGQQWVDSSESEKTSSYTILVYSQDGGSGPIPGSGGVSHSGKGSGGDSGGALVFDPDGSPADTVIQMLSEQDVTALNLKNNTALFAQLMNVQMLPASKWFQLPDLDGEVLEIHIPLESALLQANGLDENSRKLGVYRYDPKKNEWEYIFGKYDDKADAMVFSTEQRGIFALFEAHKTFPDISDCWAREYIEILAARQIVDGTGNGYFEPQKQLTRAEYLKMLIEALDIELEPKLATSFTDVDQNQWYYCYAATAQKLGIATGVPGGCFNPNHFVLRQDMSVMAVRALTAAGIKLEDNGIQKVFIDENDISEYAREAVKTLVARGILTGDDKGRFLPRKGANRAEAAKIIYLLR